MTLLAALLVSGCLAVEGEQIVAADLAGAEPAFARLPAETPLGFAPAPGARRILRRAELARLGRRHSVDVDPSKEICIERLLEPLRSDRLLDAMTRALGRPEAKIELVDFSRYPAPKGEVEFPVSGLSRSSDPETPAVWRGSVLHDGKRRFRIWARVRISIPAKRLIATEDLPVGRPIGAAQVKQETYSADPRPAIYAAQPEQAVGRTPRRRIAAGQPVPLGALEAPREVAGGEMVRVEAASGAARIEIHGRAETSGRKGDTVLVRNPESGRRFRARVIGRGLVAAGDERKPTR
ncbi:MAG TPA: flagellar basal body P-ring formation chaperone FlgA [Bryobacteraceae bacterium]|nr:flagellar basal body P-ring formation chaperone FlgA [Bryobacteraceae bacterium]